MMGLGNASATLADIQSDLAGYVPRELLPLDLGLRVGATPGWTAACAANASADLVRRIDAAVGGRVAAWNTVSFTTDFWFTVPTALAAAAPATRTARYLNTHAVAANTTVPLKTMHCAELPYVLGWDGFIWRYDNGDEDAVRAYFHAPTPAMEATKDFFQRTWLAFARRGLDGADWPAPPAYARLRGGGMVPDDAPVSTRASFDLARDLYCGTRDLADTYLKACRAAA